jgi:hypothetical protein
MVLPPLTYRLVDDGVLNVVNSFARAWRGPPRGGAVEGLVEEEAEEKDPTSLRDAGPPGSVYTKPVASATNSSPS